MSTAKKSRSDSHTASRASLSTFRPPLRDHHGIRLRFSQAFSLPAEAYELAIHDHLGMPVRTLARGAQASGNFEALWDGKDETGNPAPAGRYWFRLKTARRIFSVMFILAR